MLELPAPLRSIARRQLHLLFQCCARLSDETNRIAARNVGFNRYATRTAIPAHLRRPQLQLDVRDVAERNDPAVARLERQRPDGVEVVTARYCLAHDERKATLPFEDGTYLVTYCDRLRRGIHILDGETVTGETHAIRKDAQIALACDLFDLDAASAGHLTYDLTGLVAELPQL